MTYAEAGMMGPGNSLASMKDFQQLEAARHVMWPAYRRLCGVNYACFQLTLLVFRTGIDLRGLHS